MQPSIVFRLVYLCVCVCTCLTFKCLICVEDMQRCESNVNCMFVCCRAPKLKCLSKKVRKRRKNQKNQERKAIGVELMKNLFKRFAVLNKSNSIWQKVENYPICHHRQYRRILTMLSVRLVIVLLTKRQLHVIFQNAPTTNSTNRKQTPSRPQPLAKKDFNFKIFFFSKQE